MKTNSSNILDEEVRSLLKLNLLAVRFLCKSGFCWTVLSKINVLILQDCNCQHKVKNSNFFCTVTVYYELLLIFIKADCLLYKVLQKKRIMYNCWINSIRWNFSLNTTIAYVNLTSLINSCLPTQQCGAPWTVCTPSLRVKHSIRALLLF